MPAPPHAPPLVRALCDAFRENLEAGAFAAYVRELSDIPPDVLERAVQILIRDVDRFPSIHAVRAAAAALVLPLPDEAAALNQVEYRTAWIRQEPRSPTPPSMHELVHECLRQVGGIDAWRRTDQPSVIRGQFLRLYRDARAARLREVTLRDFPQPKELPA